MRGKKKQFILTLKIPFKSSHIWLCGICQWQMPRDGYQPMPAGGMPPKMWWSLCFIHDTWKCSESFVVVVLWHCRLVHMKFTGHVVKPWTVYFCADGLTELWGTLHKMLKLMGTCHVLMRVRCTYPYIDCGHQLFWVAHNHSKQIDWQH